MKFNQSALLGAILCGSSIAFSPKHIHQGIAPVSSSKTALSLQSSDVTSAIKTAFEAVDGSLKSVITNLDKVNVAISEKTMELLRDLLSQVRAIMDGETIVQQEFTRYATTFTKEIDQWLAAQNPQVESFFHQVADQLSVISINTPEAIGITTVITYFVVTSVLTWDEAPPPSKPYPLQKYDPVAAQAYFDGKALDFVSRALEIAVKSLTFGLKVLNDQVG